ncbi:unnamed protein product [Clonostachys byssicola]|uniref:Uncharacterized protein n=1 Tax=Clonostachys byssicola TaxID=160290 RepID=A0A9N9U7U2_9HYPO|nr:unnamed protein product [Clonostachys byssicola]
MTDGSPSLQMTFNPNFLIFHSEEGGIRPILEIHADIAHIVSGVHWSNHFEDVFSNQGEIREGFEFAVVDLGRGVFSSPHGVEELEVVQIASNSYAGEDVDDGLTGGERHEVGGYCGRHFDDSGLKMKQKKGCGVR